MALTLGGLFRKRRLFVLSLDGVPYTFLQQEMAQGRLPHMQALFARGSFRRMLSVIPPISSVAWASYMTGRNPAGHSIFGFVDRIPESMELFIPTGAHLAAQTIWDRLSRMGKKVVVINVPMTSPPRPVNGILISCFLSPNLDKAVYPPSLIPWLKKMGYQIDIDAKRAREDRRFFIEELNRSTSARLAVATRLMEEEEWDFFHLHIMGTDRINHFLWRRWEDEEPFFADTFRDYYQSIDRFIGRTLLPHLETKKGVSLCILSDHGFCRLEKEVYLNAWLREEGWLKLRSGQVRSVEEMHTDTKAYSLIPGRVYLNLKGREREGCVDERNCRTLLEKLREELYLLKDPDTGAAIIEKVFLRDEIYRGPYLLQAPDLVALPHRGYDLKGNVDKACLTAESELEGMHTFDDAFLFLKDHEIKREGFSMLDVTPTVLSLTGCLPFPELDGRSLV